MKELNPQHSVATKGTTSTPFFSQNQKPFFAKPVQAKLEIDNPNSTHEHEARQVAERVASGNNSPLKHAIKPISSPTVALNKESSGQKSAAKGSSYGFQQALVNSIGKGQKLDRTTKRDMENSFGTDFSNVHIHTDSNANKLTKTLGARAFATGQDIFFKSGHYNPHTTQGKSLLAHELTHTIQQKGMNASLLQGYFIQGERIQYRTINWADFEGEAAEGAAHDASVYSGVEPEFNGQMVHVNWTPLEGDQYELSITYNRDAVSLRPYMDSERSWKAAWLTDDDAAREKLGEDADIGAARSRLLAHEQVHFRNAQTAAARFEQRAKEQLPTEPYTETITATSQDDLETQARELLQRKSDEASANIQVIVDEALAELGEAQSVYDTDTNHSQNTDVQQEWYDDYDRKYREAVEPNESEVDETEEEHAHEAH